MPHAARARLIWIVLVALVLTCLLQAEPIEQLYPHSYVSDFAGVLDSTSVQSIEELAHRLEYWTGAKINVVTVRTRDGATAKNYALQVFNQWTGTPESPDQQILIVLVSGEERFTTVAGPRWQPLLSAKVWEF